MGRGALSSAQQSSLRKIMTRCSSTAKSAEVNPNILKGSRDIQTTGRITRYALYNFSKKNYQSMADVPYLCPKHEVDNARSRMRISFNLWIMGISSIMFVFAAFQFKRDQANSEHSWVDHNRAQHQSWKDQYNFQSSEK